MGSAVSLPQNNHKRSQAEETAMPFPYHKIIISVRERCNYRPINCRDTAVPSPLSCPRVLISSSFTRKNWLKAGTRVREKLKSDYSLLQSSSFQVEVALKLSTVNCWNYLNHNLIVLSLEPLAIVLPSGLKVTT